MAIKNDEVVNSTSKYIVKSTGKASETNGILVDANKLTEGTDGSLVSLIECYYVIESVGSTAGKLTIISLSIAIRYYATQAPFFLNSKITNPDVVFVCADISDDVTVVFVAVPKIVPAEPS